MSELAAVIDKPETVINAINLRNSAVNDITMASLTNAISSNKSKVQVCLTLIPLYCMSFYYNCSK
jgi:hypothetical protein